MLIDVVRARSIHQPYIEMILEGTKRSAYRTRRINIREWIYLCAFYSIDKEVCEEDEYDAGKVVMIACGLIWLGSHRSERVSTFVVSLFSSRFV